MCTCVVKSVRCPQLPIDFLLQRCRVGHVLSAVHDTYMYAIVHVQYACMYVCTDAEMYVCTDVWMYRCMDVRMYVCTDVCMYRCIYVQM